MVTAWAKGKVVAEEIPLWGSIHIFPANFETSCGTQ
jgi:hypothetical protein